MTATFCRRMLFLGALVLTVPGVGCGKRPLAGTTYTVMVGPGPCDLSPSGTVTLHMGSGSGSDQMRWDRMNTTAPLSIVFKGNQLPVSTKPFMNMTQVGSDWVIGSNLQSGAINPQLSPPPAGYSYKYEQVLGTANCDGRIIIQR